MRGRYHDLIGKQVITADGRRLGRVIDLVAERQGEALSVTALLVGQTGLARRIGFKRILTVSLPPPRAIPWRLVARIAGAVHLRASAAEVEALNRAEEVDVVSANAARPDPDANGDTPGRAL